MIRHGSPCKTVGSMGSRPTPRRMPSPETTRAQGVPASKSSVVRNPAPHEIALIRPVAAQPEQQRLPEINIPKPLYP